MIDTSSTTTVTRSSRRTTTTTQKLQETTNGDLSNGSSYQIKDYSEADRSWDFMNYSDYHDYRRRKSGSFDTSRVSNSASNEEGTDAPGFIFRYYKKFGFYWNVFPKTDYCYLPGSPDYHKEVSPGIPKVPNLSRYPLSSYIRRGVAAGARHLETNRGSETSLSFSEKSFLSSTTFEKSKLNLSSNSAQNDWHGSVTTRKSLPNNHKINYQREESHSSWRIVKTLMTSISTMIWSAILTIVSTTVHVSRSVVATSSSELNRSCSWLPMFLFFLLLLPLVLYYLFPGVLGANQEEIVTAVSNPASDFFSWAWSSLYSTLYLVKESILFIPTIYFQLAALFITNSSSPVKTESPCTDLPAQIITAPQFPMMNFSSPLSEEKLLALQTEIIEKLKTEIIGQNSHLTAWIEQIQHQLTNLTLEMKKMSNQFEGDQKKHFHKLKEELSDLQKAVIDVRDQAAVGSVISPSEKTVERAVAKYHADRTGKPDYALQSSGGYIVKVRCAQTYTKTTANYYILGLPLPWDISNGPETIIKPGVMPGECWAFEGSFAQVVIHLATKVRVTSFSVEHSPKELALDGRIISAPKQFSVWALENEDDHEPVFLGRFTFLDNEESLQEFDALPYDQAVELIELKVESNHGHPEYTCFYRFRVHGVPSTFIEAGGNITSDLKPSRSLDSTSGPHTKPYR